MKLFYKLLFIVLPFVANTAFAQTFITKVSAKVIGKKDVLQVEYVAENVSITNFMVPHFDNWVVVSGPNFSSNSVQSGKLTRQQFSYSFGLLPKATGKLLIPGAIAKIDNQQQKSNTLLVEVKKQDHVAGATPSNTLRPMGNQFDILEPPKEQFGNDQFLKRGENGKDKIKDNILVKVEVNKNTCYVGEPILATYKLCSRLKSQSRVVKQPGFTGATVIEMTMNDPLPRRETINGKPYNVYVIRQVQLFPLQAGTLVLPASSVENKVSFYNAKDINYRDLFYDSPSNPVEEVTLTLENKPATIEVKPLPEKPTGFSGGIGNFDVSVSLSSQTKSPETNSTNYLSVIMLGEGNLKQVKLPEIKWPSGIESFEPREAEQTDETFFPMRIRKEFTIPFVVNKKGDYIIPSISFIYFDGKQDKYVTKATAPLSLHVLQGKAIQAPSFIENISDKDFQIRLYIILAIAFCSVLAGLIIYNNRQKRKQVSIVKSAPMQVSPIVSPKTESLETYLFQIRELQPGLDENFYKKLCNSITGFVNAKFPDGQPTLHNLTNENLEKAELLEDLKTIQDICKQGMYTPLFSIDEAMQHRLQAIQILTRLEKETFA